MAFTTDSTGFRKSIPDPNAKATTSDWVPPHRPLSQDAYNAARTAGPRPMPSGYRGMQSWGERENDRIARMNPAWYDDYGRERRGAGGETVRPFGRRNGPRFGGGRGMNFRGDPNWTPGGRRMGPWGSRRDPGFGPANLGNQPDMGATPPSAPLPPPNFNNMPPQSPLQGGPAQNRFRGGPRGFRSRRWPMRRPWGPQPVAPTAPPAPAPAPVAQTPAAPVAPAPVDPNITV